MGLARQGRARPEARRQAVRCGEGAPPLEPFSLCGLDCSRLLARTNPCRPLATHFAEEGTSRERTCVPDSRKRPGVPDHCRVVQRQVPVWTYAYVPFGTGSILQKFVVMWYFSECWLCVGSDPSSRRPVYGITVSL